MDRCLAKLVLSMASEVGSERQATDEKRACAAKAVGDAGFGVSWPPAGPVDRPDFARLSLGA